MNRRKLIKSIGAAALVTTAGCTGGDGGGDSTPTSTPTTPNEQAVEHYQTGIDALISNKETLDDWAQNGFDGEASDLEALRDTLATAEEALTSAEAAANPNRELADQISQAQLVATLQEGLISFNDLGLQLGSTLDDAGTLQENEQHGDAAEKWGEGAQIANDGKTLFDETKPVHDQINNEVLDEPDLDYSGDLVDYIDTEHRQEIVAVEDYCSGFEMFNLTFVQLEAGFNTWENEEFVEARSDWETGRMNLEDAQSNIQAVIDNEYAPDDMNQVSNDVIGAIEAMFEVFDKFIQATHEAEDGNHEKAQQLVGEGFDILDQIFN